VEGEATDFQNRKRLEARKPCLGLPIRGDKEEDPLDNSSFLTTLLRRGMGGKRKAMPKFHLMLRASMASGESAALQDMKRVICAD
jgi:hypothetical protein